VFYTSSTIRGGTGVIWGNTLINYNYAAQGGNYRDLDSFSPWGACNGISPWDTTDGVLYVSGTHNGANGVPLILTDTTKNFTAACAGGSCINYELTNVTQRWSCYISSLTTTTASVIASGYGVLRNWNTGDAYQIRKAYPCLDQSGRGAGVLLSGLQPTPSGPVNQASEPIYVWNNVGYIYAQCANSPWGINVRLGRHFIDNGTTPKPGYTPYTYPHPLVSGAPMPTSSSTLRSTRRSQQKHYKKQKKGGWGAQRKKEQGPNQSSANPDG
jgi:hypothetical protein